MMVKLHIISMGLSYVQMLTTFYVDNGDDLPVWDREVGGSNPLAPIN
jgi:hypothetical protein